MTQRACFAFILAMAPAAAPAMAGEAASSLDALLAKYHHADAPGCAVGVYRGADLLDAGAFGMANLELGVPITPASAFDIGSTSKQFTAASVLLLARDGKLSLDDDIRRHVPELPRRDAPITLRNLLHHTGGVRDYIDLLRMGGTHDDDVATTRQALDMLARQQGVHFAPGARHEYSNSGYFLAGLAVERASGQSLREFARQRIFEPLGMGHTVYRDDHAELVPGRAMAYSRDDAQAAWRLDVSNWEQMGDGGIVTTVGDLARWNGNFHAPVVGDAALLAQLEERGTLADGRPVNYALGLMHGTYKGHRTIHHGGSWGGYISNLVRYPEQRLGVAVLCNSPDQPLNALIEQVADLYLPAAPPAPASAVQVATPARTSVARSEASLARWVGTYRPPFAGDVATFRLKGSALEVDYEGSTYPLRPVGDDTVEVGNVPVEVLLRLEPATGDLPRRIHQRVDGNEEAFLVAFEAASPTVAELDRLAGRYACPEVAADYRVEHDGIGLTLVGPRGEAIAMTQRERGYFVGQRLGVRFDDGPGMPRAMELGTARAHGVHCERK